MLGVELQPPQQIGRHAIDQRQAFDPTERQKRQVLALENHVQHLIRGSQKVREQFYLYKVAAGIGRRNMEYRPAA